MEDDPLQRAEEPSAPASYIPPPQPAPAIAELLQQEEAPRVGGGGATVPRRRLRIVVTSPQKSGEGVGAHYLWQVSTTDLDTSRHSSVKRRYNDWLFLRDELNHSQPGSILPPMPGKNPVKGKLAPDDFMEERRQGLQAFLVALAEHGRLGRLAVLQRFLEATDADWAQVHADAEARDAPGGGGLAESAQSVIRWVRTTTQGWQNSYTDTGRALVGEADPSFEATKGYVDASRHQLGELHGRVGALAANRREAGFAHSALADDLRALARTGAGRGSPESARMGGSLAVTLDQSADACARLAAATGPMVSELSAVAEAMDGLAEGAVPVQEAVEYRAGLLAAWQTCQADVAAAEQQLGQAQAGGNPAAYVEAARQDRLRAGALEAAARQRYDGCVATMRDELRGYEERREHTLRRTLRSYLVAQLASAEQTARVYQEALDSIDMATTASTTTTTTTTSAGPKAADADDATADAAVPGPDGAGVSL